MIYIGRSIDNSKVCKANAMGRFVDSAILYISDVKGPIRR